MLDLGLVETLLIVAVAFAILQSRRFWDSALTVLNTARTQRPARAERPAPNQRRDDTRQ